MKHAREVLSALTGWEGEAVLEPLTATIMSPMHLAAENDLWLVRYEDERRAVLRILRSEMKEDFDCDAMVAGALAAADAGMAPAVMAHDAASGVLLMEHLGEGWRAATMADLWDTQVRRGVLAATDRLHKSGSSDHRFDPFERLDDVVRRGRDAGTPLPADFDWLVDCARQAGETMAREAAALVPCRNDGASSNIMLHEDGRVSLIDYDQAGMNDPAYDFGVLMSEGSVFEDEALAWLEMEEPAGRPRLMARAQVLGAVDDLIWATRSARHAHISERIHVEFRKYSEWRFMRARRVLADRRYEWMLRVVEGG